MTDVWHKKGQDGNKKIVFNCMIDYEFVETKILK